MMQLVVQSGKNQGQRLVLPPKEVTVGRDPDCQIRLNSSLVSRRHCSLKGSTDGIWVKDLASQNGTYVNDVPISEPTLLQAGDLLRVGALVLVVQPAGTEQDTAVSVAAVRTGSTVAKPARQPISDNEIADWLTEGEPVSESDTTIINRAASLRESADRTAPSNRRRDSDASLPATGPVTGREMPRPRPAVGSDSVQSVAGNKSAGHSSAGPASRSASAGQPYAASTETPVPRSGTATPSAGSKRLSVREEAAEIIRRHWQKVRERDGSSG